MISIEDDKIGQLKMVLDKKMQNADSITIVPHKRADFDAIGSAIALYLMALKHQKNTTILIDDPIYTLDSGVQTIIKEIESQGIDIIDYKEYKKIADSKNLLILTDTSQASLVPLEEEVIKQKVAEENLIEIDHHPFGKTTIQTKDMFIFTEYSSACEVLTKLLFQYKIKFHCNIDLATYLYAGIWLDSNKLTKKGERKETHKWAGMLVEEDADLDKVNELFSEDLYSDRKVQDLITNHMNIFSYTVACMIGEDNKKYTPEELVKAADYSLKYKVDAAFAVGKIDNDTISISARSKGKINAGAIMQEFNGGGNLYSAAAKIKEETASEVGKKLIKSLKPEFYLEQNNKRNQ